jgi:hypothetical protein
MPDSTDNKNYVLSYTGAPIKLFNAATGIDAWIFACKGEMSNDDMVSMAFLADKDPKTLRVSFDANKMDATMIKKMFGYDLAPDITCAYVRFFVNAVIPLPTLPELSVTLSFDDSAYPMPTEQELKTNDILMALEKLGINLKNLPSLEKPEPTQQKATGSKSYSELFPAINTRVVGSKPN